MRTAELTGRLEEAPAMLLRALRQTARHHAYAAIPVEAAVALDRWLTGHPGDAGDGPPSGWAIVVEASRELAPELGNLCGRSCWLEHSDVLLVCLLDLNHEPVETLDGPGTVHGYEAALEALRPPTLDEQDAAAARIAARWARARA